MDGIFITELDPGDGHPAGGQGPVRHGRRADDLRLGRVRRARAGGDGRGGAAGSRRPGYANVGKTNLHEFAYGVTSQNPHYGTVPNPAAPGPHLGRLERRLGGGDRGRARRRRRSAPTPAARSASRPPAAAIAGLQADASGSCRSTASSRSRRASTTPGRWRATSRGCVELMAALVPGFAVDAVELDEVVGRRRLGASTPTPLVRARVEAAAALFPRSARARRSPSRSGRRRRSCARSPASTASSTRSTASCTARTSAHEDRALPRGDRRRGGRRARRARREYERLALEALEGVDLLLTPTLMFVAPPADVDELAVARAVRPLHLPVQPARLAGARAAVRAGRGRPAGVGPARRPARATTRSCSPPGSRSRRR